MSPYLVHHTLPPSQALPPEVADMVCLQLPLQTTREPRAVSLPATSGPPFSFPSLEGGGSLGASPWQAEANASLRPTVESKARSCPLWLKGPSQLFSVKVHLKLQTWKAVGGLTPPTPPPRATVANGSDISDGYPVLGSTFQT